VVPRELLSSLKKFKDGSFFIVEIAGKDIKVQRWIKAKLKD